MNRGLGKGKSPNLDNVDLKPDRERILSHTLKHLAVDFTSWEVHWLLLLWRRSHPTKVARYRGQILAPHRRMRSPRRVLGVDRDRVIIVRMDSRRVRRDVIKNEDDPLLCVAPNPGPPPHGRIRSSFSFSFSFPFTLAFPVRSLSLRLIPNDSFDALRTTRLVVVPSESPELAEPCLRCFLDPGVGVSCGSCNDEMSIDGRCMQSNPVLVSLSCTCIRSSTRRMSTLSAAGGLVDVLVTLMMTNQTHELPSPTRQDRNRQLYVPE